MVYSGRTKWKAFKEDYGALALLLGGFSLLMLGVGVVANHQKKNEPPLAGQAFVVRCACGSVMTVVVPPPVPPQPEFIPVPIVMPMGR